MKLPALRGRLISYAACNWNRARAACSRPDDRPIMRGGRWPNSTFRAGAQWRRHEDAPSCSCPVPIVAIAIMRAGRTRTLTRAQRYHGYPKPPSQFLAEMGIGTGTGR